MQRTSYAALRMFVVVWGVIDSRQLMVPDFLKMTIKTIAQLCSMLKVTVQEFQQLLAEPEYSCYTIPKKNGGFRTLESPQGLLLEVQGRLAEYMQPFYTVNKLTCVHGFVKAIQGQQKFGVLSNAKMHISKPFVMNMDIKNFFDSITTKQVKHALLRNLFFVSDEVATAIALLCTHRKKLPTGAPTSPVLSNIVFYCLDDTLMQLVDEINATKSEDEIAVTYTRYADDLTFSGNESLVLVMVERINSIISYNGFEINIKKTRGQRPYAAQWVTGVKVNEKLNVSRLYIRRLRAILHSMQNNNIVDAVRKYFNIPLTINFEISNIQKMLSSVRSQIAWVGLVRGKSDEVYLKLKSTFALAERKILAVPED